MEGDSCRPACFPGVGMIGSPSLNLTWSRRILSLSSHDLWTRPYDTLLGEEKPKLSKESHIWLDLEN